VPGSLTGNPEGIVNVGLIPEGSQRVEFPQSAVGAEQHAHGSIEFVGASAEERNKTIEGASLDA
jgi:hypothetical protein